MADERQKGVSLSAALHVVWLLLIVFGLPSLFATKPPEEPTVITVELLPITGVTNVKPMDKPPEKVEDKAEEKSAPKPSPPVNTAEKTPPPPPKEEKKAEKKQEKPPEPKKEEKKKEKEKPEDLAAVLKAVKETAQKEKKKDDSKSNEKDAKKTTSQQYDPSQPMSLSEKDAIMSQIEKCWSPPSGAKEAQKLVIIINAEYAQDGTLIKAEASMASQAQAGNDPFYRAALDSALRATRMCNKLQGLAPDKYSRWHEMELQFDPSLMLQ